MALFDDPEKELRRLQAELLAEEADEEEFSEEEAFEEAYEEYPEEWDEDAPYTEGGFTRNMSEVLLDEEADSSRTVYYKDKQRKKRPGCLIFLLLLAFLIGGWLAWTR